MAVSPDRDPRTVTMGAYDFPYEVARKGFVYTGGVSYALAVDWGPFSKLTLYSDFAHFEKTVDGFRDSRMSVTGLMAEGKGLYIYFDAANGKSHPWPGPVWNKALADGAGGDHEGRDPGFEWATRFNMNIGYYF